MTPVPSAAATPAPSPGDTVHVGSSNFTSAMTDQNRNVGIITGDRAVVGDLLATLAADVAGAAPY